MGRSGTSAITRVLSLCGGALPAGMMGSDRNNPRGYWEPRAVLHLNDKILRRNGIAWEDPSVPSLDESSLGAQEYAACVAEIAAYLTTLPAAPLVVIKDPRITLLHSMWFDAARQAGLDVAAVIAVRHPQEVIASLAAIIESPPEIASALWLKFSLLAEKQTRGVPRAFVEYANLLEDWRREMTRVFKALAIDLGTWDERAIDEFLEKDFRRQQHSGEVPEFFGTDWIATVYEALGAAARDERCDGPALDRVFEAYRANETSLLTGFEDFRARYDSRRLRPSFLKLVRAVRAIANRRSGTWS
ncbi:hypothetical protein A5765_05075 [Mycolicibacterium celeriflavum]|uniref:sulfotransferase family protein n=1 Tax=Mycolicibacterium celeriflavum TaxID=1249101 RepID=UPI0007FDD87B|nr:sulfotransferase family protein [Mycolicibacterium celeriflavum]OBG17993.1 hypothetical protein A5765_05075 [Mycolicibacterium celeriflavum]